MLPLLLVLFSCRTGQEEMTSGEPVDPQAPVSHIMLSDAQIQLANISTTSARTGASERN